MNADFLVDTETITGDFYTGTSAVFSSVGTFVIESLNGLELTADKGQVVATGNSIIKFPRPEKYQSEKSLAHQRTMYADRELKTVTVRTEDETDKWYFVPVNSTEGQSVKSSFENGQFVLDTTDDSVYFMRIMFNTDSDGNDANSVHTAVLNPLDKSSLPIVTDSSNVMGPDDSYQGLRVINPPPINAPNDF